LLARADSGQLRIMDGHPMSLTEAVQLCFEDLNLQAEGISLDANIDPDIWIMADEVLITQILVNLFSNAIKYNCTDGQLKVALSAREGHAELRVRNTGDPIPATDSERIFERFFRVDEAHARTCDGVGLGLSLAREIARGHNGELSLDVAEEGWNTFLLTLPVIPRPEEDPLAAT
jgi:two-component system heavy metal sensor histidine kinase CusS